MNSNTINKVEIFNLLNFIRETKIVNGVALKFFSSFRNYELFLQFVLFYKNVHFIFKGNKRLFQFGNRLSGDCCVSADCQPIHVGFPHQFQYFSGKCRQYRHSVPDFSVGVPVSTTDPKQLFILLVYPFVVNAELVLLFSYILIVKLVLT